MDDKEKAQLEVEYKKHYVKGWDELLVKLKAHGGDMIVPAPEPERHVQMLLSAGRLFDTSKLKLKKGEPHRCHGNAGRMWGKNKKLQLVTGYALHSPHPGSRAGLWSQHSWCWNPSTGELIETIGPADKYFGAVFDDFGALHFAIENVPEYDDPKYVPPRMARCAFEFLEREINREDSFLASVMKISVANKTIGKLKFKISSKASLALMGAQMLKDINKEFSEFLAAESKAGRKNPARKAGSGKRKTNNHK